MPYAGNDRDFWGKIEVSPLYKVNGGLSRCSGGILVTFISIQSSSEAQACL